MGRVALQNLKQALQVEPRGHRAQQETGGWPEARKEGEKSKSRGLGVTSGGTQVTHHARILVFFCLELLFNGKKRGCTWYLTRGNPCRSTGSTLATLPQS